MIGLRRFIFLATLLVAAFATAAPAAESGPAPVPATVTVSYRDLLPMGKVVRTGATLAEALAEDMGVPQNRAVVQPVLDRHLPLLMDAVEMIESRRGPPRFIEKPLRDVVERYPAGGREPAWVEIFRAGRAALFWDGDTAAVLFVEGRDAAGAYERRYPMVRHALAGLLPTSGGGIAVRVYAFENDYARGEYLLRTRPHTVRAAAFPPPRGRRALDLDGMRAFFGRTRALTGMALDPEAGLVLLGEAGAPPTLAGAPADLSDLAVAYRAAFHTGDNAAFVSLDPHDDPTRVAVSFGGLLGNTRIGRVVLEADKRFKTLTTGLDPNTFRDVRGETRRRIPDFLTTAERDLSRPFFDRGGWRGTRFWFYPESVEVKTDLDNATAVVARARFTADAERSREDFANPEEFERRKAAELDPSVRRNIDHLNERYDLYAAAFPELRDLETVARLMGLSNWLRTARTDRVDLDALLSVELPPAPTPEAKPQLLASNAVVFVSDRAPDERYVVEHVRPVYLTPILDSDVRSFFGSEEDLGRFLAFRRRFAAETDPAVPEAASAADRAEAATILEGRPRAVRDLVRTKNDLKALAEFAADRASEGIETPERAAARMELDRLDAEIEGMRGRVEALQSDVDGEGRYIDSLRARKERIEADRRAGYSYDEDEYEGLIRAYNDRAPGYNEKVWRLQAATADFTARIDRFNRLVREYNASNAGGRFTVEIGGGINLEPEHFTYRRTEADPDVAAARALARTATTHDAAPSAPPAPGSRVRSQSLPGREAARASIPRAAYRTVAGAPGRTAHATGDDGSRYWFAREATNDRWHDQRSTSGGVTERRYDDRGGEYHRAETADGDVRAHVVGAFETPDRIVFRLGRRNLIPPADPPAWWTESHP